MLSIDIIPITHILFISYWSRWSCPVTELWGAAQWPVSSVMLPDLCVAVHPSNSWALGSHLSDANHQPLGHWWVSIGHNLSQWEANRLLCWGFEKKHTRHSFPIGLEVIKRLKLPHPSCNHRGSTGLRRINLDRLNRANYTLCETSIAID